MITWSILPADLQFFPLLFLAISLTTTFFCGIPQQIVGSKHKGFLQLIPLIFVENIPHLSSIMSSPWILTELQIFILLFNSHNLVNYDRIHTETEQ